jgi:hypothetical protein
MDTDYYLKDIEKGGNDNSLCTSYTTACATLDKIMINIIYNSNLYVTVYIDFSEYNCTVVSSASINPCANAGFTLTAYNSPSFFPSVMNTYPVIFTNTSNNAGVSVFYLNCNISATFEYLKFLIGSNSYSERYVIESYYYY